VYIFTPLFLFWIMWHSLSLSLHDWYVGHHVKLLSV
jgi:hypothetical protein